MKRKRISALVGVVVLAAAALVIPWSTRAGNGSHNGPHYKLEGTWVFKVEPPYDCLITATYVPESPANNRVAFTFDFVDSDPLFPGVEYPQMTVRGEGIRTGPRTFEVHWIFYGRYADRSIGYIFVGHDSYLMTSPNTLESFAELTLYWPEDDIDGDGLPDQGGTPLPPGFATAKRYVPVSH